MSITERAQDEPALSETTEKTLVMIGQRIRDLRKARGMTLQALAEVTGLSSSMLSLVERGLASPSIGSLIVISDALGKTMSALVSEGTDNLDNLVVRARDAQVVKTAGGVIRRVMKEDITNDVTVAVNEYAPQTGSSEHLLSHDGFEYGLLMEGTLIVEVEGMSHLLYVGDMISYPSRRPHRIWNPGPGMARSVWFNIHKN